jgi:tRNA modification GTPase
VVIAGQPNAGKSSLLNALAGAELAIVTPIAGTTRDVVRQTIQIEGVPLHVLDTAGLRAAGDAVEQIGIERAWQHIEQADAVLWLHDLTRQGDAGYAAGEQHIADGLAARGAAGVPLLHLWNKHDAAPHAAIPPDGIALSARTGEGLDALRQRLLDLAGWQAARAKGCSSRVSATCRPWRAPLRIWKQPAPIWRAPSPCSSCWPRNCAWRRTPWAKSPAPSAPTTCWA